MSRAQALDRLAGEQFDVLIVGGGITGAGVARDAALRGLSVALVEARDFASGTSSRSSKLIHGGLRYLEQGEIALVREAARERAVLRRMAPHLAMVAPMLVPVFGRTKAGIYKLKAGLALFDRLAGVPRSERHRILTSDEALVEEPRLARERLQGAALYPEYLADDARLVLDTIKSAGDAGATVANYVRVLAFGQAAPLRAVRLEDVETGASRTTRARVVVNAAGPWVDELRTLDGSAAGSRLHLTKGIHLVFRAEDLPVRHCVVMRASDRRPVFAVPYERYVYVGTTDTSYEGPLDEPPVTPEDAEYLLDAVRRSFDGLTIGTADVIGAWAGLRPLVHEEGKRPSEISRKDEIIVSPSGMVTIAGGKLTTYRRMAERVMEKTEALLGRTLPPSKSATLPLAGGDLDGATNLVDYARSTTVRRRFDGVPDDTTTRLLGRYGSDALAVATAGGGVESLRPLGAGTLLSEAEVRYAVRGEMARTVTDVLERRSRVALFATGSARAVAPRVASILAEELGWSEARRAQELAAFERAATARLAWRASGG